MEIKDLILIALVLILIIVLIPKFSFASTVSPPIDPAQVGRTCNNPIKVDENCPQGTFVTTFSDDGSMKTCCSSV
jgi:hypothetical protein